MTDFQILWNTLIEFSWKDLLTPIAAIFVVFLTQFTIAHVRRRELLDDWWENYAVTQGIQPVMSFLFPFAYRFLHPSEFDLMIVPDLPCQAMDRFGFLVHAEIPGYCFALRKCVERKNFAELEILRASLPKIQHHMIMVHALLLDIHINDKSDVLLIHTNRALSEQVKLLNAAIRPCLEAYFEACEKQDDGAT